MSSTVKIDTLINQFIHTIALAASCDDEADLKDYFETAQAYFNEMPAVNALPAASPLIERIEQCHHHLRDLEGRVHDLVANKLTAGLPQDRRVLPNPVFDCMNTLRIPGLSPQLLTFCSPVDLHATRLVNRHFGQASRC